MQSFIYTSDLATLKILVKNITEPKKREDFLQLTSTLKPADELLLLMQEELNRLVDESDILLSLVNWIYNKSLSTNVECKPIAVRTFYLALIRVLDFMLSRALDPSLSFNNARTRQFISHFEKAYSLVNDSNVNISLNLGMGENPISIIARLLVFDFEPQLKSLIHQLHSQLVALKDDTQGFQRWRQACGQNFIHDFRNIIGHNTEFSEQDKQLLKRYYCGHDLLLSCLYNENCQVTELVQKEIEETLLLPF
jgi:hypothetical protein